MDLGLKGKVALVCAASQGLGYAVASELAAEGALLILCSRNDEKLQAACAFIRKESEPDVLGVAGDLSQPADIERIVDAGFERYGKIDILVTNTGGPPAGQFDSLTRESTVRFSSQRP